MSTETGTAQIIYLLIPALVIIVGLYLLFIQKRRCPTCGRSIRPIWKECPCASEPATLFIQEPQEPLPQEREEEKEVRSTIGPETRPFSYDDAQPLPGQAMGTEVMLPPIFPAWLIVKQKGKPENRYEIKEKAISIGSSDDNDIILKNKTVSRHHAKIRLERQKYFIYDLASTNGTRVNGRKITKKWIQEGDSIEMGKTIMTFKTEAPPSEIPEHKPSDLLKM